MEEAKLNLPRRQAGMKRFDRDFKIFAVKMVTEAPPDISFHISNGLCRRVSRHNLDIYEIWI